MDPIRRRLVRLTPGRADCGLPGTARRGRPAWPRRPCRLRAAPREGRLTGDRLRRHRPPDRRSPFAELTTFASCGAGSARAPYRQIHRGRPGSCIAMDVCGMHDDAGDGEGRDTRSHREAVEGREPRVLGVIAADPLDLSILAVRERAIRFWLAGIGLLAFGAAYVAPIGLAIRMPTLSHPVALPALELPVVSFPTFAVPRLHAAPAPAPAAPSAPPTEVARRVVRQTAPQHPRPHRTMRHGARTVRIPAVRDSYSLLPPQPKAAKPKPDPFAAAPVVEDAVGVATQDTAPAVDDPAAVEDSVGAPPPDMSEQDDPVVAATDIPPAPTASGDPATESSTEYRGYRATGGPPPTAPTVGGDVSPSEETASAAAGPDAPPASAEPAASARGKTTATPAAD